MRFVEMIDARISGSSKDGEVSQESLCDRTQEHRVTVQESQDAGCIDLELPEGDINDHNSTPIL